MMSEEKDQHKKGENPTLDEGYIVYRKMKIFAGDGVSEALSDKEGTLLVKLWCKEKATPWKMFKQEVRLLSSSLSVLLLGAQIVAERNHELGTKDYERN